MKCVRIYITPNLLTLINIAKGLLRKKLKEDAYFFCDYYTHTKILPLYIPWDLFTLNMSTIQSRHPHILMGISRCHCYHMQMVLSQLCLDHPWNIACRGARAALTPGLVSVIFPPLVGSNKYCPQPGRRTQGFRCGE